jgi:type IV secretion system protein VirB8
VIHNELHQYAIHRNTVDPMDRQRLADRVHLHSSQEVGREYDFEMSADNPGNPYYLVGPNGKRTVEVTGISLLNRETGQVSFKTVTRKSGSEPKTEFWTAIVRFTFTGKPLALNDRWENPLGFAVTAYRRDQELSRN